MTSSSPPGPDDDHPTVIPPYDVEERARRDRRSAATSSLPPENETPTVIPPFDLEEMARQGRSSAPAPSPVSVAPADAMPTVMPPFDVEAARRASMRSIQPGAVERATRPPPIREPRELPGDEPEIEVQVGEGTDLDPLDEAHVLAESGDDSAALAVLEGILEHAPMDAPTIQLAEKVGRTLSEKYMEQLGSLERIPRLAIPLERLVSLSLDNRAGFLLSLVDGSSTIALLIDLSGMTASEVLGTLVDLKERGILVLRE